MGGLSRTPAPARHFHPTVPWCGLLGAGIRASALSCPVQAVIGRGPRAAPELTAVGVKPWRESLQTEAAPTLLCSVLAPEIPVLV